MKYAVIIFLLLSSFALAADDNKPKPEGTKSETSNSESKDFAQDREFNVALALQNSEDYQSALDRWNTYLTNYPKAKNIDQVRYYRGICYYHIGQFDKASQDLDSTLENVKTPTVRESALFFSAMAYREQSVTKTELLSSAKERFEQLLKEFPNTGHYLYAMLGLGDVYSAMGDFKQAFTMYKNTWTRNPLSTQAANAYLAAGNILYEQKADAQCVKLMLEFQARQKQSPLRFEAATLAGDALFRSGNLIQAELQYAIASDAKATGIENFTMADYALHNRGACYFSMKKYEEAINVFTELKTRFPESKYIPSAELSIAGALQMLGKMSESKDAYLKAVEYPQNAKSANLNLAKIYFEEDDIAKAVERIDLLPATAYKAFPGMPADQMAIVQSACTLRAKIYGHLPDIEHQKLAVQFCDEITTLWPKDTVTLGVTLYAAQLQFNMKEFRDCIDRSQKVLDNWGQSAEALEARILIADSLFNMQQYKESGKRYYELFKANPQNPRRYEWLIHSAISLDKMDRPANVLRVLVPESQNIKDPSLRAETLYLVGKAYLEEDNIANAKTAILKCLKEFPQNPDMDKVLYILGKVYSNEKDTTNATLTFQKIIDEYPQSVMKTPATNELAQLNRLSGEIDKSLESYDKIIAQDKKSAFRPGAIIDSAVVLYQNERLDQAIERTAMFINDYPDNDMVVKAYYIRVLSEIKQKKFSDAMTDCQTALSIAEKKNQMDEWELELRSARMLCLAQDKNQVQEVISEFDKLQSAQKRLKISIPDEDNVLFMYANALFNAKLQDQGKSSYEKIFTQFPKSKHRWISAVILAQLAIENKDMPTAKNYLTQTLESKDALSAIRAANKLGLIAKDEKDYKSAYNFFDKSCQIFETGSTFASDDPSITDVVYESQFQKAEMLFSLNDYVKALEEYQKLTQIPEPYQVLAYVHASQCAIELKKFDVSAEFIAKGLDDKDGLKAELIETSKQFEPALQGQRAMLLLKNGELDKAEILFKRITDENKNIDPAQADQTSLHAIANAWFCQGDLQMNKQKYREAIPMYFSVIYGYQFPTLQADACYEAARCFESLEQVQQAEKMYKMLLEICPTSSKANIAKSKLHQN